MYTAALDAVMDGVNNKPPLSNEVPEHQPMVDDDLWDEIIDEHKIALTEVRKLSNVNVDQTKEAEELLNKPPTAETAETLRELICTDTLSLPQRQLLALHRKSNHCLSMVEIQELALQGHYPKNIGTCPRPVCAHCLYGKAHKKPWRTKGKKNRPI